MNTNFYISYIVALIMNGEPGMVEKVCTHLRAKDVVLLWKTLKEMGLESFLDS